MGQTLSAGSGSNQLQEYNVVGAANSEFTKGAAQWLLSTYRFGLDTSTSYIAGVVYADTNGNGSYDPGEGLSAEIGISWDLRACPEISSNSTIVHRAA
jgi:hypothetical protein